jgi:hypothetical protein
MASHKNYITDKRGSQAPLSQEERDVCLVESLNRYIEALEGRIGCLEETVDAQRGTIEELCRVVKHLESLAFAGREGADDPLVP